MANRYLRWQEENWMEQSDSLVVWLACSTYDRKVRIRASWPRVVA